MKSLVILLLFISTTLFSQIDYKVFAKNGNVSVVNDGLNRPVKTGEIINSTHSLIVGQNSYISLYSPNKTAPIEIKVAGEYKVSELKPKPTSDLMSKYTEFILSSNSDEQKRNRMSATGAVHRGNAETIKLILPEPKKNKLYGDEFIVRWQFKDHIQTETRYTIRIQNMMGDDIKTFSTNDTQIQISLSSLKYFNEKDLLIVVESGQNKSDEHSVVLVDEKLKTKLKTEIEQLNYELEGSEFMKTIIVAGYYEENGCILDALNQYLSVKNNEEVWYLVESFYEEFLVRNNLK